MGICQSRRVNNLYRAGNYHRFVPVGKRRIKDGEQCMIWDRRGNVTKHTGPKLKRIWMSNIRFCDRHVANDNEYLEVKFRDGRRRHIRGPCAFFQDPIVHTSIVVKKAISLNAFEAIVVYRESKDEIPAFVEDEEAKQPDVSAKGPRNATGGSSKVMAVPGVAINDEPLDDGMRVERRVVRGPALFFPASNEWIHKFTWHGSRRPGMASAAAATGHAYGHAAYGTEANDRAGARRNSAGSGVVTSEAPAIMVKGGLTLTKLRTLPDQLYYDVPFVRTQDDAQLTSVKLMIFYQMTSIEQMLNSTHDPIGDMVNAVQADVMSFCSRITFETFTSDQTALNDLKTFPTLVDRATSIGFKVNSVVFRGYKASDQLQKMHDKATESRTKLQLQARAEEQSQAMQDLKLRHDEERASKVAKLEEERAQHELRIQQMRHAEGMRQRKEEHDEELVHLSELVKQGLDLTRFLVAQQKGGGGGSADARTVRVELSSDEVEGGAAAGGRATPHIHIGKGL